MKTIQKRLLSWVLALAMTLSLVPANFLPAAQAAGTGNTVTIDS